MTTETQTNFKPADTLANRLVLIRRELGLSQREAAIRCGVGFGSWQSWEKGSAPRNALRDLAKVAKELGVDRDWLLFGGPLADEESRPANTRGGYEELPRLDSNQQPFGWRAEPDGPPSTAELRNAAKPIADLRRAIRRGSIAETDTLAARRVS